MQPNRYVYFIPKPLHWKRLHQKSPRWLIILPKASIMCETLNWMILWLSNWIFFSTQRKNGQSFEKHHRVVDHVETLSLKSVWLINKEELWENIYLLTSQITLVRKLWIFLALRFYVWLILPDLKNCIHVNSEWQYNAQFPKIAKVMINE